MRGQKARRFFQSLEHMPFGQLAIVVISQKLRQAEVRLGRIGRIKEQKRLIRANGLVSTAQFFSSLSQITVRRRDERIYGQHSPCITGHAFPIAPPLADFHQAKVCGSHIGVARRQFL
jgi:hypothetical protein